MGFENLAYLMFMLFDLDVRLGFQFCPLKWCTLIAPKPLKLSKFFPCAVGWWENFFMKLFRNINFDGMRRCYSDMWYLGIDRIAAVGKSCFLPSLLFPFSPEVVRSHLCEKCPAYPQMKGESLTLKTWRQSWTSLCKQALSIHFLLPLSHVLLHANDISP